MRTFHVLNLGAGVQSTVLFLLALGPAPKLPFNRKRFLSTFRWFRDYAGGYITDYGTHRFDTVHQVTS